MWGNSILIGGIEQRPGDMVICHKLLVVQFGQYWIWDIGQSKSKGEVKEGPVKKPRVSCWRFWITACRSEMIGWQFWSDLYCNHLLNLNFSRKDTVNLLPSPGSPVTSFCLEQSHFTHTSSWKAPTPPLLMVFIEFSIFFFMTIKPILGKM